MISQRFVAFLEKQSARFDRFTAALALKQDGASDMAVLFDQIKQANHRNIAIWQAAFEVGVDNGNSHLLSRKLSE